MSLTRLSLTAVATLATVAALSAARPTVGEADVAEKYFGCQAGYTFQRSGSSARCYLAGPTQTADILCGIGYVKTIDQFNGGKDGCQQKLANTVGNYTCPSGFTPKVQAGPDHCAKAGTESIMAPAVVKWL
jgi:hypothetical protein